MYEWYLDTIKTMLHKIWSAVKNLGLDFIDGVLFDNIANYLMDNYTGKSSLKPTETLLVTELSVEAIGDILSKYTDFGSYVVKENSISAYTTKPYTGKTINHCEYDIKTTYNEDEELRMNITLTPKQDGTLILFKFGQASNYYRILAFFWAFLIYFALLFTPLEIHVMIHVGMWLALPLIWYQRIYSLSYRKSNLNFWKTAFYAQIVLGEHSLDK